jgi:hypothetical protein
MCSGTVCATEWNVDINIDEVDVTTFCSTGDYREYILGFKDGTGSFTTLECYDFQGSSCEVSLGNDDVTYSGSVLVNGHSATNAVDARAEYTWNFRFTGPVSISCGT